MSKTLGEVTDVFHPLGAATAAFLLIGTLSACSPACGSGVSSGEAAVAGLISAARNADDPEDLCAFVATSYVVSDQDLAELRERYAEHPDDTLDLTLTGQLGSTASVVVTDGSFTDEFDVTSDSDSRWTVAFGTLFG